MAAILAFLFGLAVAYLVVTLLRNHFSKPHTPLPPGPKGLPLVGNLYDFPKPGVPEAIHWLKHAKLYGPISSLTVGAQTVVIINDVQLAVELLDKRSAIYSSRPEMVLIGELVGWERNILLSPYNRRLRAMRKNVAHVIGSQSALARIADVLEAGTAHTLLRIIDSPGDFWSHIKRVNAATTLELVYGYTAECGREDILVRLINNLLRVFSCTALPGTCIVDMYPFLKWLPAWVPGMAWKRTARQWAVDLFTVAELPHGFVKQQMARGSNKPSFMSELLEAAGSDAQEDDIAKWTCFTLYAAGADTVSAAALWFYMAMAISPEIQSRAQEEIDRVVGKDRLPTLADRENLPYVEAIVKETLRWRPPLQMGFWHQNTEDDMADGYFIPKGSMVLANLWQFTHDPNVHANPEAFQPERFLATEGREPEADTYKYAFGFGRRVCAGMNLAYQIIFLMVAQSLAALEIRSDGEDEIDSSLPCGVTTSPPPFKCAIRPRSSHHEKLVRSLESVHPWRQSDEKALERLAREGKYAACI